MSLQARRHGLQDGTNFFLEFFSFLSFPFLSFHFLPLPFLLPKIGSNRIEVVFVENTIVIINLY